VSLNHLAVIAAAIFKQNNLKIAKFGGSKKAIFKEVMCRK